MGRSKNQSFPDTNMKISDFYSNSARKGKYGFYFTDVTLLQNRGDLVWRKK